MSVFDGVGDPSVDGMCAAVERSGLVGPRPLLFMTSAYRDGGPYHGSHNATDWGNDADQWNGSPQMDDLAVWLGQHYGPVSLEIIHTFRGGAALPGGVYWKNGQPVDGPGFYGMDTVNAHRGHVHFAITNSGLAAVPIEEFTMDAQAKAAFAALTKTVQDNSQQLVTVIEGVPKGKANPFGLVGIKDLDARLDRIEAVLVKLAAKP